MADSSIVASAAHPLHRAIFPPGMPRRPRRCGARRTLAVKARFGSEAAVDAGGGDVRIRCSVRA